jgi:hypothetical protein
MPRQKAPSDENAEERLVLRVKGEEKTAFEAAAAAEHLKFSPWARRALHKAMRQEARERESEGKG